MRHRSYLSSIGLTALAFAFIAIASLQSPQPMDVSYVYGADKGVSVDLKLNHAVLTAFDQVDINAYAGASKTALASAKINSITVHGPVYLGNKKRMRLALYLKYKTDVMPPTVPRYRT